MGIKQNKNYPANSLAARGIFLGGRTWQDLGFTEEQARRWWAYGISSIYASRFREMGITLDMIDNMNCHEQNWFRESANDNPCYDHYISDFVSKLHDEFHKNYTREQDEIEEFDRNGNRDLIHAARSGLRRELIGVNDGDDDYEEDDDADYIDVSVRTVSSKKPLMLKSNNG
jgi:hypothetical protein